jgi:hypothetical protein
MWSIVRFLTVKITEWQLLHGFCTVHPLVFLLIGQLSVGWRQDYYLTVLLTIPRSDYLPNGDESFSSLLDADFLVIIKISSMTINRKNFNSLSFRRVVDHPTENFKIYPHQSISINWIWDHLFIVVLLGVASIVFIRCQYLNLLLVAVWQLNQGIVSDSWK